MSESIPEVEEPPPSLSSYGFDYFWNLVEWIIENRTRTLGISALAVASIAVLSGALGQLILLILIIAEFGIAIVLGEYDMVPGIEFVTFIVVFTAYAFGGSAAVWVGVLAIFMHYVLSRNLDPYTIYVASVMAVTGWFAGMAFENAWFGGNLFVVGIISSVIYNILSGVPGIISEELIEETFWGAVNLSINGMLLWKLAPILITLV